MRLKIILENYHYPHVIEWFQPILNFPKVIKHLGKYWEWVTYNPPLTPIGHDFDLLFTTIEDKLVKNFKEITNLVDLVSAKGPCVCGAVHTSIPWDHMRYCPLWKPWKA